ncbi:MAG: trypsin-like peptidase domain-containing protein [Planctomycetes bacterium]|nr:trypsin-like peptidase domain-containing protein [Planctomycetota bacterium]
MFTAGLAVVCLMANGRADDSPKPEKSSSAEDQAYQELAAQVAELEKFSRVFESVAKLVGPAVVHIQSKKAASVLKRNFTYEETGSGVIVRLPGQDGPFILTNHHVVENVKPEQLLITTSERRPLHALTAWSDANSDIAVLALAEKDVPTVRLGDSDRLQIGHWVLAIGSPFDLAGSLTHGIVSGKGRRSLSLGTDGVLNQDFIQSDAPINPGNSGGPLVNLRGEVVGINTAIASQSGGSEGVGFSIPINFARRVAVELIEKGSVTRGYLGIGLEPSLNVPMAVKLGLPRARGAIVQEVFPDTPAAQAGIQRLDVILQFRSKPVEDMEHLIHMISMTPVGEEVTLMIWRNRREVEVTATVGDRAQYDRQRPGERPRQDPPKFGIDVLELTDSDRARLELGDQKGVLVTRVWPHSAAAQWVEPFDVIDQVEGKPIASVADWNRSIRGAGAEFGIRVRIVRPSPRGVTRQEFLLKP